MPDYTFSSAVVLIESTGALAIGATGVLRPNGGGDPVQLYDLNDSPISSVLVGPKGVHQAFKADIPNGTLDFGSVLLPAVSLEQQQAGLEAEAAAQAAQSAAESAAASADLATSLANTAASLAAAVVIPAVEDAPAVSPTGSWDFTGALVTGVGVDGTLEIADVAGLQTALNDKVATATYTAGMAAKQDRDSLKAATQAWHPVVLKYANGAYPARPASAVQAVFIGSADPGSAALTGDEWVQV